MTYKTLRDLTIEDYMIMLSISETFKGHDEKIKRETIKHFKLEKLSIVDTDNTLLAINDILSQKPNFLQRFELNGVEYGFIPNLDNITTGEWIDIENYQSDPNQIDKLVSILYRPIKRSFKFWKKDYYSIDEYNGTNSDLRKAPLEVYLGAMVFFFHLGKSLLNHISTYTKKITEEQKDQLSSIVRNNNFLMNSDGTV